MKKRFYTKREGLLYNPKTNHFLEVWANKVDGKNYIVTLCEYWGWTQGLYYTHGELDGYVFVGKIYD